MTPAEQAVTDDPATAVALIRKLDRCVEYDMTRWTIDAVDGAGRDLTEAEARMFERVAWVPGVQPNMVVSQ